MGRPPGRCAKERPFEEVCGALMYKIEALERPEALGEPEKAALRADWARRRTG